VLNLPCRPLSRVGSFGRQIRTSRLRACGYRGMSRLIQVDRLGVNVGSGFWISEAMNT
jgi:hypothetical protein